MKGNDATYKEMADKNPMKSAKAREQSYSYVKMKGGETGFIFII